MWTATVSEPTFRHFIIGLGRAFGGAILFALPILMTMEMWQLGFIIDVWRLAILCLITLPLLLALSYYGGFRRTFSLIDDLADVFVALFVAIVMAVVVLAVFGILTPDMSWRELLGKVAAQAVPGSIGAMLARSQLGGSSDHEQNNERSSYWGELFLMATGAIFLAFNVAPTEEIMVIAFSMDVWREIFLALLSLMLMHIFVYASNFKGGASLNGQSHVSIFLRFSLTGYVLSVLISLGMLWIFGRSDGLALPVLLHMGIVLGFPASVGAATARLVL